MPAPDPDGISIDEYDGGRFTLTAHCFSDGNRRNRIARLRAIMQRLRCGGWKCWRCGEPVPLYKRADARFCAEGCRKAAARDRRRWRGGH